MSSDARNLQSGKTYGDKAALKEKPAITEETNPAEGKLLEGPATHNLFKLQ
ncbi:hypothetical protein AB0323_19760 [Arthrobacter sp. NPDC080031]|uniref:hypothetical protein n=1 Tax=Arthrobacter sp. NPDC080031 TaxID=3155918 RepID=UPI00344E5A17